MRGTTAIFLVLLTLLISFVAVSAKSDDDPLDVDDIKDMIKDGESDETIIGQIEARGLDFELDNQHLAKISMAGASADLMFYLNDPDKYWASHQPVDTKTYGAVVLDIEGSWVHTDNDEVPVSFIVLIDGEEKKTKTAWDKIIEVGSGGGNLYGTEYVTKMVLEPGYIRLTQIETGTREIDIAVVINNSNPGKSTISKSTIFSRSITVDENRDTVLDLEAYNDSNDAFKLK